MCWAEKFVFCVPLNLGCVLLGAFNIVCAIFMVIASMIHFAGHQATALQSSGTQVPSWIQLGLEPGSLDIVYGLVLAVALTWILFSWFLIMGIIRNKSSFILVYFFFGILLVIFGHLSGLLLVLRSFSQGFPCLELGSMVFILSMFHIHFLVAVHTVYELMQRGKDFRFHKYKNDVDHLLTDEAFV